MAVAYRASAADGSSTGTSDRTCAITPAVGDLFVVFCAVSVNTNNAPTCSDDNSGAYTRVGIIGVGSNTWMSVFIRTTLLTNTTSTTVTVATGANDSGEVVVVAVSGMSKTGIFALRSLGQQDSQVSATPAPTLDQTSLTTNMTLGAVARGANPPAVTQPTNWLEKHDVGQNTPAIGIEVVTRDSGFAGTTVTWGSSALGFGSWIMELNGAQDYPVTLTTATYTRSMQNVTITVTRAVTLTAASYTRTMNNVGLSVTHAVTLTAAAYARTMRNVEISITRAPPTGKPGPVLGCGLGLGL
jgi:hypothetical protein